ncbi:MAG: DUF2577 domain-containing protein [Ruminococcaceae bacterium]|nr:DUF2577 domain-containing protein [Oscillospiraceae bacterium]
MELIELIKQAARDAVASEKLTDVFIGKVIDTAPLTVMIDSKALISEDNLLLSSRVCLDTEMLSHSHTASKEDEISQIVTLSKPLSSDDLVIVLRCHGGGTYVILDRIKGKE